MNNSPLVSIICTAYNHEAYINDALEGFVMQKTSFSFEIIVHDDASTDNTANIVRGYEAKYPNLFITIYQSENQYSKKDVNIWTDIVFPLARGKYIALCEGDDYWIDPLKLQKQVDFLEANEDYSMCFHNAIKYYDSTKKKVELFNNLTFDSDLTIHDAVHNWIVPTASIVGRTKLIREHPAWLCHIYSGDFSLILSLFHYGKIRYINKVMSFYRITTNGSSMTAIMLFRNVFILEQQIMLLESYNKGTNYLYSKEINFKLKFLKSELRFQKAKQNYNIIKMLLMPKLLLEKTMNKLFPKI